MAELRLVLEYCPVSDYERLKRAIESSVQAGQEEILRALVSNDGRNLNDFGVDVLFEAVEDISDLSVLKFLLRRLGGEAIGQVRNELNLNVVHLAALIQDRELAAETMQTLRNALGDGCFSVVSGLNSTAAHFAAKNSNGHEVLIWILDNLGQQALTVKDSLGDTAVHLAAEFQTDECMRLLKAKLPQRVWQARGALRRTPVHRAALNCTGEQSGDTLKWMLENLELEVFKKPDAENNTAVHLAARHQGFECMQMLQDRLGASCFLTPGYQLQTAVHMAARNENGYAALEWFVTNIGSIDHLLIKDANGDTAVHVAAEYQDDECMQLFSTRLPPEHNVWQMEGGLKRTPVHRAALNEKSVLTLHWILDYLAKRPAIFQLRDAQGDTAIHLAAQVQSDECMELLSQHLTLENPVWNTAGAKGRKPVHCLAANAIQREFLKVLVDKLGSSALTEVDEELLTAIHLAASYQSLALFQSLVSCAGKDSITLRDKHGWTPLFMATGNERHEKDESVFFWMMNQLKGSQEQELASKDSDGRTCLHLCARNRAFGAQMFVQSAPQHQFDDPSDAVAASVDKNDRNPLFLACLLKNFNFFKAEFIDVKRHMCIDSVGNTLLHALFLTSESFPNRDFDADEFVSAVKKLIDGGVDPKVENNVKKNCLMSAEFSQRTLYDVLVRLSHLPELKEAFSRLQRNSDGLHVVHVFSGRYDIRFLEAPLKQLFTLSSDKLLNIRVSSGSLSGATCLHFACEAGHEENLRFLIGKGLCDARLGCETASGQTCVDFACNKGKLDVLRSAAADAGVDLREILLLVDPVKKALQLPDKTSQEPVKNQESAVPIH
ncbi:hypothetical protein BOX15_Mlig022410g1 [Macrostomum lignano]|uniref:ANK_REP_REGION domain-containing protein n=1 Tax=Macrostomum lignano TaxID=282301 RepID=A0A267EPI0_9PLAT|nr:hypothetical protein BOX15_Mlig022410g1 [Macrostomum lignano]